MANSFNENVRFSYFLPYGFVSPSAALLGINIPEIANLAFSPKIPMSERLDAFNRAHEAARKQLNFMVTGGYAKVTYRKFSSHKSDQFRVIHLTKSGLYLLTNTPDPAEEKIRLAQNHAKVNRRKIDYRSSNVTDVAARNYLYAVFSDPDSTPDEIASATELMSDNILDGNMSILTCGIADAIKASCTPNNMNSSQFYRCWRAANINALFMANNFLTYLDRRPMDTQWKIGRMRSAEDYQKALHDGTLDIPALSYYALTSWYESMPDSYCFLQPQLDLTAIPHAEWCSTPAFYQTSELPGLMYTEPETLISLTGAANAVRHTFEGVAIGSKETYIVHHTRPRRTPWIEDVERRTAALVATCLRSYCPGYRTRSKQVIDNAIIVCDTVYQFEALFENARDKMPKRWRKLRRVGVPYNSVSIIPINASGAMQLRILLLSSPEEFEAMIIRTFTDQNSRINPMHFTAINDPIFQLTVTRRNAKNTGSETLPVLLAHTMNYQRLYYAWERYDTGEKFLVGCYPGQVKFIRKIMPNIEFI